MWFDNIPLVNKERGFFKPLVIRLIKEKKMRKEIIDTKLYKVKTREVTGSLSTEIKERVRTGRELKGDIEYCDVVGYIVL